MKFGIGQPVRRFEDVRLLTGKGRFQDDQSLARQSYAVFVHSPHAHAAIRSISTEAASRAPGVIAVYTGADYAADGLGMPKAAMPRKKKDGSPMFAPQRPALVVDRVRYVGDPVALVIAHTLDEAKDAAELVEVEYEPLPSVTEVGTAAAPGAPRVWDENPDNISHTLERGDRKATDEAFARAAHVVRRRYVITRVHAQYMEPRGSIGTYDAGDDRYTLYADVNYPHRVRNMLANVIFKVPESKVRVVCQDVGGGFGAKGWQYVDHRLTLWAARKVGRPVRWSCERSQVIMADEHGRDNIGDIELALAADGRILGLRLHMLASIGAYIASDRQLLTPFGQIGTVTGVYDIPAAHVTIDAVLSNTNPTAPYRGAGRPEAIYLIERILEVAAEEMGIDPIELRRRNLVRPGGTLATGQQLGSDAAAEQVLERALVESDFEARRAAFAEQNQRAAMASGLARFTRRGIGLSLFMHGAGLNGNAETLFASQVLLRGNADGTVSVITAQIELGQGTHTILAQLAAEGLGMLVEWVTVERPDTAVAPNSGPTVASRTATVVGGLLISAGQRLRAEVERHAGGPISDLIAFRSALAELAAREPLQVRTTYRPPPDLHWDEDAHRGDAYLAFAWSCCVVALEVDTLTGEVKVLDVTAVQDIGKVVHPLFAAGQVEGGVTQGLGWALMEEVRWTEGAMLNANLADYAIPTAADAPPIRAIFLEHPHSRSPHGAKGLGELPANGPAPAIVNALRQALGIHFQRLPVTPEIILLAWEERLS